MTTQEATSSPTPPPQDLDPVGREIDGAVGILTMRYRPHNLLDPTLTEALTDAVNWANSVGVRAVILRSALRHFSAGADLDKMLAAAVEGDGVQRVH